MISWRLQILFAYSLNFMFKHQLQLTQRESRTCVNKETLDTFSKEIVTQYEDSWSEDFGLFLYHSFRTHILNIGRLLNQVFFIFIL